MRGLKAYTDRAILTFLVFVGLIMTASVKDDTLTTDEGLYLPTGIRIWMDGNIRLGFEHPPLMRDLAALPIILYQIGRAHV